MIETLGPSFLTGSVIARLTYILHLGHQGVLNGLAAMIEQLGVKGNPQWEAEAKNIKSIAANDRQLMMPNINSTKINAVFLWTRFVPRAKWLSHAKTAPRTTNPEVLSGKEYDELVEYRMSKMQDSAQKERDALARMMQAAPETAKADDTEQATGGEQPEAVAPPAPLPPPSKESLSSQYERKTATRRKEFEELKKFQTRVTLRRDITLEQQALMATDAALAETLQQEEEQQAGLTREEMVPPKKTTTTPARRRTTSHQSSTVQTANLTTPSSTYSLNQQVLAMDMDDERRSNTSSAKRSLFGETSEVARPPSGASSLIGSIVSRHSARNPQPRVRMTAGTGAPEVRTSQAPQYSNSTYRTLRTIWIASHPYTPTMGQ